ncbi:MAG TPA: hypothetical protein VMF50_17190 [Candidatus Binataceae bacterium]|nr:hypothetical protein [Candidatus Binataceae bacterium]
MGTKKPKKLKAPQQAGPANRPRPADLPLAAIPDFDDAAILGSFQEFDAVARALVRHLAAIQVTSDEVKKNGLIRTLVTSENAGQLAAAAAEAESALQACSTCLRPLRNGLEAWKAGERRSRKARFERIADGMGWKVIGSWPEPVIDGIVFVALDELKDRATVNGRAVVAPTAERLADHVAVDLAQLTAHLTSPTDFVASMWQAYQASGGQAGHGVLFHDLLGELTWLRQSKAFQRDPRQDLYREYSAAQFRADLTHYLSAGGPPVEEAGKQYELEVVGGSFAEDGLFMYFPQTDRLATCGRLTFKSVNR